MWKYAGTQATAEHNALAEADAHAIVTLHDENYRVAGGYYIPYYPSSKDGEEEAVTREKLAIDLTKRFFRNAELGINVRFSQPEVAGLRTKYESLPQGSEEQRAAGALLVGAMMNRIERLAHALLQNRALMAHRIDNQAIAMQLHDELDLPANMQLDDITAIVDGAIDYSRNLFSTVTVDQTLEHQVTHNSPHEKFKAYEAEIKSLYSVLVSDQALVRCVRRRDRSTDREGILYDMIRDAGKAEKIPLQMIFDNRVLKISQAMHDIDRVTDLMLSFARSEPYSNVEGLTDYLSDFATIAKRRAGTKTDYAEHYIDTEIAFKATEAALFNLIKSHKRYAIETGATNILEGFNLMQRGIALVDDMAEIRQSRNIREIDPPVMDDPSYNREEKLTIQNAVLNSIDRLEHDINQFIGRRITPTGYSR